MVHVRNIVFLFIFAVLFTGCISTGQTQDTDAGNQSNATSSGSDTNKTTPTLFCVDSDGNSLLTKGNVKFGSSFYEDGCAGAKSVVEQVCKNNEPDVSVQDCKVGLVCIDGQCIEDAAQNQTETGNCTDSDGGIKQSISGKVSDPSGTYSDYCLGGYTSKVKEYYCKDNKVVEETIECAAGYKCSNGKCIEWQKACTKDQFTKTTTLDDHSGFVKTYKDYCKDGMTIIQYSCEGSNVINTTVKCGDGELCSETSITCKAKECAGPIAPDEYTPEAVVSNTVVYADSCSTPKLVKEYYCNGVNVESTNRECPYAYECTTKEKAIYVSGTGKTVNYNIGYCTFIEIIYNINDSEGWVEPEEEPEEEPVEPPPEEEPPEE